MSPPKARRGNPAHGATHGGVTSTSGSADSSEVAGRVRVPRVLALDQARELMGPDAPSVRTMARAIKRGELRTVKGIGRLRRVTDVELVRWLNEGGGE